MTGKTEEVDPFDRLQLESASHGRQDLGRDPDVPALLEPRVPGEADAGEVGDLLPAQAGRAAPATVGEAHGLWRDATPATLEKAAQLGPGGGVSTRITRHLVTG